MAAMRLMAAWTSLNIVTLSGAVVASQLFSKAPCKGSALSVGGILVDAHVDLMPSLS